MRASGERRTRCVGRRRSQRRRRTLTTKLRSRGFPWPSVPVSNIRAPRLGFTVVSDGWRSPRRMVTRKFPSGSAGKMATGEFGLLAEAVTPDPAS